MIKFPVIIQIGFVSHLSKKKEKKERNEGRKRKGRGRGKERGRRVGERKTEGRNMQRIPCFC